MQEGGGERVKTAGRELTEGRGESVSAVINGEKARYTSEEGNLEGREQQTLERGLRPSQKELNSLNVQKTNHSS